MKDLDRSVVSAIAWMGAVKWAGQIVAWLSTFVVARLLSPTDYGIVGAASLYLGALTLISEFGIGSAVLVLRTLTPSQLRQMNTVSVTFGLAGFLLSAALARPVARFFHSPQTSGVVMVLSVTFLINSLKTVPWALLQRDFRFRRVAAFEGAQQLALALLSVTLAVLGFRYWTLVIASVASACIPAAFALGFHHVGFSRPRLSEIRNALTFSTHLIVQRIAWFFYSNSDFLVAGRMLGTQALGAYTVGWTIANAPIDKVANVMFQVAPSALSAVQDDGAAMARYVSGLTEVVSAVTFPLFFGLVLVANDFVPLVLGAQWRMMIVPLQILAAYACFKAVLPILPQVLTMRGEARFAANNSVLAAILLPITFIITSRWGITGIALGWVLVHPLIALRMTDRALASIGMSFRDFFTKPLWPALSGCAAMTIAVVLARMLWPTAASQWSRLIGCVLIGAASYIGVIFTFHADRVRQLRRVLAEVR